MKSARLTFQTFVDILSQNSSSFNLQQFEMRLKGKTAIVTGGTGALGSVIAGCLFREGANIAIPFRSESLAGLPEQLVKADDHLLLRQIDLAIETEVEEFVRTVMQKFGSVDILVNAAGGYMGGTEIQDVSGPDWDAMMTMNLKTTFLICKNVLKIMRANKSGRIVNTAAMPAISPSPKKGPYSVSKRGVITLTETIAEEVKGTGITANAIAPSIILTDANTQSMPGSDFSKWVTTEEIADLVLYLCSDAARSINGNVIKIYGGV